MVRKSDPNPSEEYKNFEKLARQLVNVKKKDSGKKVAEQKKKAKQT